MKNPSVFTNTHEFNIETFRRVTNFHSSNLDPQREKTEEYIVENSEKILAGLLEDEKIIEYCEDEPKDYVLIRHKEEGDFIYYYHTENNPSLQVHVYVYPKKWLAEREEYLDGIFQEGQRLAPERAAERIPDLPVPDFTIKETDIPVDRIIDGLGEKIDFRVRELVRLLNMIGLKTSASCGGHILKGRSPWLRFPGEKLEQLISLFNEWKKYSDAPYEIWCMGTVGENFDLRAKNEKEIQKNINNFDCLTDWLEQKIGIENINLTAPEKIMRERRKLKKILGFLK